MRSRRFAPGLVLSHEGESPVGLLGEWLTERGCRFDVCDVTREPLPALAGYDFVASLGSSHSATDTERDWVVAEIELLREAIASWARSERELAKLGISPRALRDEADQRAALAKVHAWELFGLWWEGLTGA